MKKVLKLVVFMFVFFAGMNMVMAQGPKSDGYIKLVTYTQDSETTAYLYSKTETIQTLNGISYDEQSNILTLNNYNPEASAIEIHNMGDFKINVIGSNVINSNYKAAIDVTGNNSTTVYGGGSISFSGYIGIKTDTGILNIENVSLSNKFDGNYYLIISESKVNIEDSTLSFDFFGRSYSYGILGNDDITIKNSNISGNVGTGIATGMDENSKGNISIINSTVDMTITYHGGGILTENELNIENSSIKIKDGGIVGETTNISNSNIDIKYVDGEENSIGISAPNSLDVKNSIIKIEGGGIGGLTTNISNSNIDIKEEFILGSNLNINDSNLNVDTAGSSCIIGKDIIINGGTMKLKSSNTGIGLGFSFYAEDNPTSSLTIKNGNIDITALTGIGVDDDFADEGTIADFTMENGKLVIKSTTGIDVANANFKGGYVEIDASNKDKIFDDNLVEYNGTVFATKSINIASNIEVSNNAKIYKLDDGKGFRIYYLNDEEVEYDKKNTFSKPLLKNVIIKDKNYKEEEITTQKEEKKNDVVENPKTADITINIVLPLLLGAMFFALIGIQKLKKINHK